MKETEFRSKTARSSSLSLSLSVYIYQLYSLSRPQSRSLGFLGPTYPLVSSRLSGHN